MTRWDQALLSAEQARYVEGRLGSPVLVEDVSWNLVDTKVLHVRAAGHDAVVKAAPTSNHHIGREITAHETFTAPLVASGRTGRLIAASRTLNVLITTYLPGTLVQGSTREEDPGLHRQAGAALRVFHNHHARAGEGYEARMTEKAISVLDREHRIDKETESAARRILHSYRPAPTVLVPTHGDWQPRNWLHDGGQLYVIDYGRFDLRPRATDLCRLATGHWRYTPPLEDAFFDGYGADPRDEKVWPVDLLREAIGTAVWAFHVGDTAFEAHGHTMLHEAIHRF